MTMKAFYRSSVLFSAVLGFLFLSLIVLPSSCGRAQAPGDETTPTAAEPASYVGPTGPGATYYVSPSGSNDNPGTKERPLKSPGFASRRLRPGDTLVIGEGTYVLSAFDDDIITPARGAEDAWITIRGEGTARPVLAGADNLLCAINLDNAAYLTIEHIEITSHKGAQFRDGIQAIDGPVTHVILSDLSIHHVDEFGVNIADADDLKIAGCDISHTGFGSIGGPAGNSGGWRNVVISDCRLSYNGHYYQGGPGPSPYDRPDGLGIEPSEGPIEIVRCVSEHNRGDGLDSKVKNTTIRDCIVANNSCDGVKLWGNNSTVENTLIYGRGDGDRDPSPWSAVVIHTEQADSSFYLTNLTVDDALGNNYLMHAQYDYPDVPITITMTNCIMSGRGPNSPIFIAGKVKLVADNNLFIFPGSDTTLIRGDVRDYGPGDVSLLGPGNGSGDPLFVRPGFGTEGDYHLRDLSPAIDAGTAAGAPKTDLDGRSRPAGRATDIGAYER